MAICSNSAGTCRACVRSRFKQGEGLTVGFKVRFCSRDLLVRVEAPEALNLSMTLRHLLGKFLAVVKAALEIRFARFTIVFPWMANNRVEYGEACETRRGGGVWGTTVCFFFGNFTDIWKRALE